MITYGVFIGSVTAGTLVGATLGVLAGPPGIAAGAVLGLALGNLFGQFISPVCGAVYWDIKQHNKAKPN